MKTSRQTTRSVGRLLLAIGVACLFVAGMTGFSFLHQHHDLGGHAPSHCAVCFVHATSASADVADLQVAVVTIQSPATPILAANDLIVSHAPLTADSRGPPVLL